MKLYVIGQSTCYGMDLMPGKSGLSLREYRQKYNFAGVLGSKLGYEVVNSSYPMCSLATITKRIAEEYDSINPDLVVVGIPQATLRGVWDPEKNGYADILQNEYYLPERVVYLNDDLVRSRYKTAVAKEAYQEYKDNITLERAIDDYQDDIIKLQSLLVSKGAKYILVQIAPIIPNIIDNGYTGVENPEKRFAKYMHRINEIDTSKFIRFDEFNVIESMRHLPMGKTGHILEEGHQQLAELIYDKYIDTYVSKQE